MTKFFGFVLAGILGGLIVLFGLKTIKSIEASNDSVEKSTLQAYQTTSPLNSAQLENIDFDFSMAAEMATKSVVHIQASESELMATKRYKKEREQYGRSQRSPMENFFNPFSYRAPLYQKKGSGSGVIISESGFIVTNNHVVEFADQIEVTLADGRKFAANIIGTEPATDLAVIKIEATELYTMEYADSDAARVGEWVLAIGNPFDYLTSTVTAGIISAKGRDLDIIKGDKAVEQFIQTDAVINPGNSGGALVDTKGRLLGVNTAIATKTGFYNGYSFAIPVNLMKRITNDIIKYGSYQHANLGIYVSPLDDELIRDLSLESDNGVVVSEVVRGGVAQFAGMLPNDIIIGINDKDIVNIADLQETMALARVGDKMDVKLIRNGKIKFINLTLKKGM